MLYEIMMWTLIVASITAIMYYCGVYKADTKRPIVSLLRLLVGLLIAAAILIGGATYLDNIRQKQPEYQARIAAYRQEEQKQLWQETVSVQPWVDAHRKGEYVSLAEPENIPGTGLSRLLVERQHDKTPFVVIVVNSQKITKGQKVELIEVSYISAPNRYRRDFVIVK